MSVTGKKARALAWVLIVMLSSLSVAGCGGLREAGNGGRQAVNPPDRKSAGRLNVLENRGAEQASWPGKAIVAFENIDNRMYADAEKMAGVIGFHTEFSEDGKTLFIGDHDAFMSITAGSRKAVKGERTLNMSHPAILADGRLLVPSSELKHLFGDEAHFTVDATRAAVFPMPEREATGEAGDFADDPADPAAEPEAGVPRTANAGDDGAPVPAAADLIAEAKRYLGVKYQFGAAHYSASGRFDCSSFVQFLFAGQGIELPRTARAQAKLGEEVPRDKLRRGDLLFFTVPGRFKSDRAVGHVGIYIGNRRMIHASPLPRDGVQITDIDKPYWKETFLFARRILP
jgi:cell wall-associated NlpC family hydrolase